MNHPFPLGGGGGGGGGGIQQCLHGVVVSNSDGVLGKISVRLMLVFLNREDHYLRSRTGQG